MKFMSIAQELAVVYGMAMTYEQDALRSRLRAEANDAAGNTDQAKADREQQASDEAKTAAMSDRYEALVAKAEADGWTVTVTDDQTVVATRPNTENNANGFGTNLAEGDPTHPVS
jgi:hypothetical protein